MHLILCKLRYKDFFEYFCCDEKCKFICSSLSVFYFAAWWSSRVLFRWDTEV